MITFEEAMQGLTNQINELKKQAEAEETDYERKLFWQKVAKIISFCIFVYGTSKILNWFQNTERHLEKIANAVQPPNEKQADQNQPTAEHNGENNPTTKPPAQPKLNQIQESQQQPAKVQSDPADFSEHPDSRYMPKD